MKFFKKLFLFLFLIVFASCGADKLKRDVVTNQFGVINNKECSFNTSGPPVCGADGKDYLNKDQAECFTTVKNTGHCKCSDVFIVCGSDGLDHSECEAITNKIPITKYLPCSSQEL